MEPTLPRIILDARKLGDGGIGVYIENLVDGLLSLREEGLVSFELSLLVEENQKPSRHPVKEAQDRWNQKVRFIPERAKKYSLSEYLRLAGRQRHELREHHLFHAPHYTLPLFLKIPSVATIHDVIHLTHPSSRYHEPVARTLLRSVVKRADAIITVSEHSKAVMLKELPVTEERISVIPNALRPGIVRRKGKELSDFLAQEGMSDGYCLFVGSEMPHKGFLELLETWALLFNDVDCVCYPHLYVVGRNFSEESRALVREKGLQEVVKFVGEVSNRRLSFLYSGARAVVIPSRAEGFGIPAIEAMSCGVPVISTPLPSLREFGEGTIWFSSDFSPESLARALRRAFDESDREILRLEKGKRKAEEFTLRRQAEMTWNVYQTLLPVELRKPAFEMPIGTSTSMSSTSVTI